MGLLDGIERLITEHGSAAILKERIELANDKYAALETKLAQSEARERQLSAEKENIERAYSELQTEVQGLQRQLAARHGDELDPVRKKLLVALSSGRETTAAQVGHTLAMGEPLATFHLEELEKAHFAHGARFYTGSSTLWKIAPAGRAYLAARGLLT